MIHPRRLKGTAGNLARYYSIGDYYTKCSEAPSEWGGRIASDLGFSGRVDPATFRQLLEGEVDGQRLGRFRADGGIEHHPGWDFAVNAPKSVSIMALVAGDDRIAHLHEHAVGTALEYLEEHALLRRRMSGEIVYKTTGRLLYARFTEHASRELDPHLHTHVVVLNMTNDGTGSPMSSLETRAMYAEQMTAGQVYRNELAHGLLGLGYEIDADPRTGLFEIAGVPKALILEMSQRSMQIEAHASEHGLTGQAARRVSFYETRGAKAKVGLDALTARWAERVASLPVPLEQIRALADREDGQALIPAAAISARAMLFGLRQAETKEAVNTLGRMLRLGLASHLGEVRIGDLRPHADAHARRNKLLTTREPTGDETHVRGRTTRRAARLELALADHLALSLNDAKPLASEVTLRDAGTRAKLTPAQLTALLHLGLSQDRVVGLHGVAGAGKSTLVRALREAAGSRVELIALAPTSSAAANLGASAGIASRTVASLLASGGQSLTDRHILVLDESGQLGSRQALRLLELSRESGARLILLGDNKQTGAIEQGKPFWLMQRLGLSKADLTESVRQETRAMKAAVTQARAAEYATSIANLDKVTSGKSADELARDLVREWTRLKPDTRTGTNILVLENTTRLVVNAAVRQALKIEGVVAPEESRLEVLTPAGMTDHEKHFARFYASGQVLKFARAKPGLGIARDTEYRVREIRRAASGRQIVELRDDQGRTICWDPRLGRASQVNIFKSEWRELAQGDRIQWRLVNQELGVRNADRGTIMQLNGALASILWDRDGRMQQIDLGKHKTWDHGYSETVYSAQSKTYDRVYVLAPVNSALVTGQNYYTAITRARFGVKLWTEDQKRLVEKLERRSGEKTSALEGLGRLGRDFLNQRAIRHRGRWKELRDGQVLARSARAPRLAARERAASRGEGRLPAVLAGRAASGIAAMDQWLSRWIGGAAGTPESVNLEQSASRRSDRDRGGGRDR